MVALGCWNLGSWEGCGQEDPVMALLAPVRHAEGLSYPGNSPGERGRAQESCSPGLQLDCLQAWDKPFQQV